MPAVVYGIPLCIQSYYNVREFVCVRERDRDRERDFGVVISAEQN